jgi:hypothetical protein
MAQGSKTSHTTKPARTAEEHWVQHLNRFEDDLYRVMGKHVLRMKKKDDRGIGTAILVALIRVVLRFAEHFPVERRPPELVDFIASGKQVCTMILRGEAALLGVDVDAQIFQRHNDDKPIM